MHLIIEIIDFFKKYNFFLPLYNVKDDLNKYSVYKE